MDEANMKVIERKHGSFNWEVRHPTKMHVLTEALTILRRAKAGYGLKITIKRCL